VSDLPPASDSQTSRSKFWFAIGASADLIAIGGFLVLLGGFLIYYLTEIPILGPVLIAFALGAFFVLMVGRLRVVGDEPILSLGSFSDYAVATGVTRTRLEPPSKPNIVLLSQRQFVRIAADSSSFTFSESREGTPAVVARFRNEPERSSEISTVRARLIYYDSQRNELGSVSHGVWLTEPCNYTNFRIGSERALVVGLLEDLIYKPGVQGQAGRNVAVRVQGLITIIDNRDQPALRPNKPTWVTITSKHLFIKVTLYSEAGVFGEDFWFEFRPGSSPIFQSAQPT